MRWGFGWQRGPFETLAGGRLAAGGAMDRGGHRRGQGDGARRRCRRGSPTGVPACTRTQGSFSAADDTMHTRSTLPVYKRQLFPAAGAGREGAGARRHRLRERGRAVVAPGRRDRDRLLQEQDACARRRGAAADCNRALDEAQKGFDALVIWQTRPPFAVGANLKAALESLKAGRIDELEAMVALLPADLAAAQVRPVPTVAAVRGPGAGRRLRIRACIAQRVVAALESYIGLVEVGVGLLPAGGGCKEIAERAVAWAARRRPFPSCSALLPAGRHGARSRRARSTRARWATSRPATAS